MKIQQLKTKRYIRRKTSVRSKIVGTKDMPRLTVYRSNLHIYGQIIDDSIGKTLASFSDMNLKDSGKNTKVQIAAAVGEALGKFAVSKKIKKVVFDRNGFVYHGRVKALADGARKGGLDF